MYRVITMAMMVPLPLVMHTSVPVTDHTAAAENCRLLITSSAAKKVHEIDGQCAR